MSQLQEWKGSFGRDYTDRNVVDWTDRYHGFRELLDGLVVGSVLEIGCNRGHNLDALHELGVNAYGVEPGDYARGIAQSRGLDVIAGDIYNIPAAGHSVDLVFTSGVLIHVPPERLTEAIDELARTSRRYLLAIEYHSDTDEEITYQGMDGMLWRRNYTALLGGLHGFTTVKAGDGPAGFDGASYVIVERSG